MENKTRLKILTYMVMAYMLLAFAWWSVLLYTKNQDAYQAKVELLRIGTVAEGKYNNEASFRQLPMFKDLTKRYKRQEWMIMGEALVFVCTLLIGIWIVNNGYNKDLMAAQQRRNFLMSITHELKSPIAGMKLVLETFQKRQNLPSNHVEALTKNGLKEAERLNNLVNDLLIAAKIESNYHPIFEPININEFFLDTIYDLEIKYPEVKFRFEPNEKEILLYADKTAFTSIFLNLIENGIKYSPQNPEIELFINELEKNVEISVADNGMGITEKERKKIFERFYRIGNEETRETKGTGLGLYIVKELTNVHKGTIAIESNKPKGTIFKISIPKKIT